MSLLTSAGKTLYTQHADSLGGLLFRNVPPGSGYRVRLASDGAESGPITVHSDAAAPWDPSIYNQSIPDNGYGYLTTRDGTKLAIDVHPPTSPAGEPGAAAPARHARRAAPTTSPPYPTLIEYSGYGYADPAGPVNGIAVLANLMGFAVVDVNMRGTGCSGGAYRLLRGAAEPRRLRRDRDDRPPAVGARPQGRDDGHLLRRDQPAVHGPARSARPRGDLAAVDDRRDRDDALSRAASSTPASRSRGRSSARQEAEPAGPEQRPAVGVPADPGRRSDVPGQPGAARRGGQPDGQDRRQRALHPAGRRPARPDHVRQQDQGAGVHGVPVGGRADGRPLPRPRPALHRHEAEVVHVHQRRPRRLARSGHVRPLVRLPRAVRRPPGADRQPGGDPGRGAGDLPVGDGAPGHRRRHAAGRPDPGRSRPTSPRSPRSRSCPRSGSCSTTAPARRRPGARRPATRIPGFEQSFSTLPDPGHDRAHWYLGPGGHARPTSPPRKHGHQLVHLERQAPCRSPTSATNTGARRPVGQRVAVAVELAAEPAGHGGLVRVGAADDEHRPSSAPAPSTCGCARRRPTSTCRRRSARCARTATRRSSRTAGSGPSERKLVDRHRTTCSSSRARCSSRSRACTAADAEPMPSGQFVEVVDPALLRGPRLPRRARGSG